MEFNYEHARHLEGELIRFKNEKGEWVVGKVVKVRKDGLEISGIESSETKDGFGYGFWGPRFFLPFGAPFFPFFWW